jgi:hypothetical protein
VAAGAPAEWSEAISPEFRSGIDHLQREISDESFADYSA